MAMIATGIVAQALESPKCFECGADLPALGAPLSEVTCPTCGKTIMMPGRLGQYHLLRLLGAGGMGAVYEGMDTGLQRKIAVKVILRDKVEEDPTFIDSFKREAQSAARLDSVNLVGVYAFGESEGQPYLVMELVQPDALDKMMKDGPLNATTVLGIGRQIAQGLKAAAEHGLVHGDVKPENILINEAREAKLADFGIAGVAGAKAAANNEVWGTPYYIAPETLRRQKVDQRADIYSLGATLYHAIAGVPPFEGETAVDVMKARLVGTARPLHEVAPHCPENISKIVMRMLEPEQMRRYPNYDSLLADIAKEIGTGKASGAKRVMLKNSKSKTGAVVIPSAPMPVVENTNAPLFNQQKKKQGLSKGVIIGIAAGGGVLLLTIIAVLVGVMVKAAKGDAPTAPTTPADAVAAEATPTVDPAIAQAAAAQAVADAKTLAELIKRYEQAYVDTKSTIKTADAQVKRMAKRAERAVLPENMSWLSPMEGEAPTEMLRELQGCYAKVATFNEVLAALETLRTTLNAAQANEDVSAALAEAQTAVAAYEAMPAVKAFVANQKALQNAEKSWQRTVAKARTEMEASVAARKEEERVAREAERQRLAAEQAKRAIEEEVASVGTIEVAVMGDLDKFMPETAEKTFKARQARLKSAEAKAASAVIGERVAAYQTLKTFWLKSIEAGAYANLNVTAATVDTVTVKGQTMPWAKFAADQQNVAFRMLQMSIADDVGARGMRASNRAELAMAAYLYVNRYLGPAMVEKSKTLRDTMKKFRTLAEGLPGTRESFKRLAGVVEDAAAPAEEETPIEETPTEE